jgi:hypothetical protein
VAGLSRRQRDEDPAVKAGITGQHCIAADMFNLPGGGVVAVLTCPTCRLHIRVVAAEKARVVATVDMFVSDHWRFEHTRENEATA